VAYITPSGFCEQSFIIFYINSSPSGLIYPVKILMRLPRLHYGFCSWQNDVGLANLYILPFYYLNSKPNDKTCVYNYGNFIDYYPKPDYQL
jgi:hypothetical protein